MLYQVTQYVFIKRATARTRPSSLLTNSVYETILKLYEEKPEKVAGFPYVCKNSIHQFWLFTICTTVHTSVKIDFAGTC